MVTAKLQLLQDTFESKFDIDKFKNFTREFFNEPEMLSAKRHTGIWKEYKNNIISYIDIAKFEDAEGNKIIVFSVELKSGKGIERARSLQRNFISKILDQQNCEAAIVAFYSENDVNWRLSFVRLDYTFKDKGLELDLTPAKRYSYLVGENETSHTAQKQLYPIFGDDKHNPSLNEIEAAFSVEKVTKDFYEQYKNKYYDLKEYLEKDKAFINETVKLGFEVDKFSEQFAKKLMGQLAFLYFLQKKGWLGVRIMPEDHSIEKSKYMIIYNDVDDIHKEILKKLFTQSKDGKMKLSIRLFYSITDKEADLLSDCFINSELNMPWGSGNKKFIKEIFDFCVNSTNKNFFDYYLEPFFYEALNKRRRNQYYKRFNCKIPFLNGGLFEPLEGYHWKESEFVIPDKIFSNAKEKGREADGILNIFDRYNFTMNEDEPLEKEVAVDPEMLGKIFENLLDIKDRKSKGAFYTPREIVHYMCQESLTNYLVSEVNVPYEDMKEYILYGEIIRDADNRTNVGYGKDFTIKQSIFDKIVQIDEALKNIRMADPAVGSGAFPLGMINEIVRARNNITEYLVRLNRSNKLDRKYEENYIRRLRSQYKMKWDTIKNSIFAVDIEPSAVDIAKLRLWLSIVVEQEIDEQNPEPHPLPNLDCNIMVGNSLIDEYEGIKLIDKSLFHKYKNSNSKEQARAHAEISSAVQLSFLIDHSDDMLKEMFGLQDRLFDEDDEYKKKEIKSRIDKIRDDLIEYKLTRDGNMEGLTKYNEMKKLKIKPFFLWQLEFAKVFKEKGGFDIIIGNPPYGVKFDDFTKEILKRKYSYSIKGKFESYRIFMELSEMISHKKSIFSFVVPNTWLSVEQAEPLRKYCLSNYSFASLIQYPQKSFQATVDTISYVLLKNKQNIKTFVVKIPLDENILNLNNYIAKSQKISQDIWEYSPKCIISYGTELSENSFIEKIKNNCDALSKHIKIRQGLIPYLTKQEGKENLYISIIKKDEEWKDYLDGSRCVGRYGIKGVSSNIKYGEWLYAPRESWIFKRPRIIFQLIRNISLKQRIVATYLDYELYSDRNTGLIFSTNSDFDLMYLLGVLNSKLLNFIHSKTHNSTYISFPSIEALAIVIPNECIQKKVIILVEAILNKKQIDFHTDTSSLEAEIDKMVYELYGLTDEEIKIVEEM